MEAVAVVAVFAAAAAVAAATIQHRPPHLPSTPTDGFPTPQFVTPYGYRWNANLTLIGAPSVDFALVDRPATPLDVVSSALRAHVPNPGALPQVVSTADLEREVGPHLPSRQTLTRCTWGSLQLCDLACQRPPCHFEPPAAHQFTIAPQDQQRRARGSSDAPRPHRQIPFLGISGGKAPRQVKVGQVGQDQSAQAGWHISFPRMPTTPSRAARGRWVCAVSVCQPALTTSEERGGFPSSPDRVLSGVPPVPRVSYLLGHSCRCYSC